MKKNNHKAFTLSEVLITLTVIGIVAMLVLPNFVNNTYKTEYALKLKKKYYEMQQVMQMAYIENGSMNRWDLSLDTDEFVAKYLAKYLKMSECSDCWQEAALPQNMWFEQYACAADLDDNHMSGGTTPTTPEAITNEVQLNCYTGGTSDSFCTTLKTNCENYATSGSTEFTSDDTTYSFDANMCQSYIAGAYKATKPEDKPDVTYKMSDGSTIGFYHQPAKAVLFAYVDVNGKQSPNTYGYDQFLILASNNTVAFWGEGESNLTSGDYGCSSSGNGMYCGAILKNNNWTFDENYPKDL